MALQEYEHTGNAPATGLAVGIGSGATSFSLVSGTNYPTGANGLFVLCIDAGTSSEEKILCQSRSGPNVTVFSGGRGYDGTSATSHSSGTSNITHVLSAAELSDYSQHVYLTSRDDHTQYARTDGTRAVTGNQTFSAGITVSSGGVAATGNSTVTGNLTVTGTLTAGADSMIPSGVMMDFAAASAPSGWLACDGSAVNRTTYASLFAAIGTTWGTGDGSTTFNLPDFRGRVTIGAGTGSGLTARTLAATGGEETHALSSGELAAHTHSHNHTGTTGNESVTHTHQSGILTGTTGSTGVVASTTASNNGQWNTGTESANHTHSFTSSTDSTSTGSGTGHNTMQPFAVVTKIIKT